MRLVRQGAIAGWLLTVSTGVVLAQAAPEDDSGLRQNCVGDYFRFCSSYLPGSSAIRQCFAANTARLTPECRGAIRAFDQRNGGKSSTN